MMILLIGCRLWVQKHFIATVGKKMEKSPYAFAVLWSEIWPEDACSWWISLHSESDLNTGRPQMSVPSLQWTRLRARGSLALHKNRTTTTKTVGVSPRTNEHVHNPSHLWHPTAGTSYSAGLRISIPPSLRSVVVVSSCSSIRLHIHAADAH